MTFFDTISSRRRKRNTSSSSPQPSYTDGGAAADTPKGGESNDFKYHQSTFLLCRQTSCISILMMIAALMVLTAPSARKNFRHLSYLRHRSQNDDSSMQTQLIEVIHAAEHGNDVTHVAGTDKVIDEEVVVYEPVVYTAEMAAKAVEPTVWTCGESNRTSVDPVTNQRPFFAFVHVYKTAGSTMRGFFEKYAKICNKSLAIVQQCRGRGLEGCRQSKSWNAPRSIKRVNSTALHDHYDILGGHFSFGMADGIFPNANTSAPQERYLVFLRQPMTRFVSHILYQQHHKDTVEDTADYIKNRIRHSREKGDYMSSIYKYLLTPEQRAMIKKRGKTKETKEKLLELNSQLSIDNLVRYNAIIGMTERFPQSIQILEQAMGRIASTSEKKEKEAQDLFSRHYKGKESKNASDKNGINTSSVLKELNKDEEFMEIFQEFVKYEQMIVDFAMEMHQLQYEAVNKTTSEKI